MKKESINRLTSRSRDKGINPATNRPYPPPPIYNHSEEYKRAKEILLSIAEDVNLPTLERIEAAKAIMRDY